MKDEEYFNDKLFVYSNKELVQLLKNRKNAEGIPVYMSVDEALRNLVNAEKIVFNKKPKKPVLIG